MSPCVLFFMFCHINRVLDAHLKKNGQSVLAYVQVIFVIFFFCLVLALCVRKLLIGSSQVFISNCGLRSPAHLLCKYLFAASQREKKSRLEVKGNGTNTTCFRK